MDEELSGTLEAVGPGEGMVDGSVEESDELAMVRELVLRAHPDVVPELVTGASVDELVASVAPARAAYQRVAAELRAVTPRVPAGDTPAVAVDVAHLPAGEMIRRGLATRA